MSKQQNSPCSFNTFKPGERPKEFLGFYERSMTSNMANNLDGYLEMLGDYFDRLDVHNTLGWMGRPFPFQWVAYSRVFEGHDDAFTGSGRTPLEAVRNLYHAMKRYDWGDV